MTTTNVNRQNLDKAINVASTLIRQFEGCRLTAYRCPAGIWTIGWGHTQNVKQGDRWSQPMADRMLEEDLITFARGVLAQVPDLADYPHRLGACISLAYNIGLGAFARSTLCRHIRQGAWHQVAGDFMSWRFINKKESKGLKKRRTTEQAVFRKDAQ